jgi:hypothetical protein
MILASIETEKIHSKCVLTDCSDIAVKSVEPLMNVKNEIAWSERDRRVTAGGKWGDLNPAARLEFIIA